MTHRSLATGLVALLTLGIPGCNTPSLWEEKPTAFENKIRVGPQKTPELPQNPPYLASPESEEEQENAANAYHPRKY